MSDQSDRPVLPRPGRDVNNVANARRLVRVFAYGLACAFSANLTPSRAETYIENIPIADNANNCIASTNDSVGLELKSNCGTVWVLGCAYSTPKTAPSWRCKIQKVQSKASSLVVQGAVGSFYVAACRTTSQKCAQELNWFFAAVDGRSNADLNIKSMRVPEMAPGACSVITTDGECFRAKKMPRG